VSQDLFGKTMKFFRKFLEGICVVFLCIMGIILAYVVFCRYILNFTPIWGDETSQFCMVWIAQLSAALALIDDTHIKIDLFDNIMPLMLKKILGLAVQLLMFITISVLIVYGIKLSQLTSGQILSDMGISYTYLYLSVPVSAFFMLVASIGRTRDILAMGKS